MDPTRRLLATPLLVAVGTLALSACGGDDGPRSDGPDVRISATAAFAPRQAVSVGQTLRIDVRNEGSRPVDALAIVLTGLTRTTPESARAADPRRPVWIVDGAPDRIAATATDTWSVGTLPAGATRSYRWRLTPTGPGRRTLGWRVASASGSETTVQDVRGELPVTVADLP